MATDPYALDMNAGKKGLSELSGSSGSLGIPCPNKNWGKPCKACEAALAAYDAQNDKLGTKLYPKKQPFMNIELIKERGVIRTLTLPVEATKTFFENVYGTGAWGNVIHPVNGLPLILSKSKDGEYIKYQLTPKIAATDAEKKLSSVKMIKEAPVLETIVETLRDNPESLNLFNHRRDLNTGDSILFKVIPNPTNPSQQPIHIGYFHFGVTQAQVDGDAPINVNALSNAGDSNATGNKGGGKAKSYSNASKPATDEFSLDDLGDDNLLGDATDDFNLD